MNIKKLEITPTICRLLLFIRFCGEEKKASYFFKSKKLFIKWFFLSRNPKLLKKLFSLKGISANFQSSSEATDKFIRCYFGVYIKNFENELSIPVHYGLIKVTKERTTKIYQLMNNGLKIIEKCQKNHIISDYKKILVEIKLHYSKFTKEEIYNFTDQEIKKYEKKIGSIIRDDEFEI